MFMSGLTKGIFESFLRSYQLNRAELKNTPFIYADPETGEVRFISNLMSTCEGTGEILAFAIAPKGNVEVLSTENG